MCKSKFTKLFMLLGVIFFSLLGIGGCSNAIKTNESTSSEFLQSKYYKSYSFDNITNWPKFIGGSYNLGPKERVYYFISSFLELKDIFETSTKEEINNYFNESIFYDNIVLCIIRDEVTGTANIKYSNFKVNGFELSIEENFIDGGAEVVSKYLDFVVIPKQLFPDGKIDQEIKYYWK